MAQPSPSPEASIPDATGGVAALLALLEELSRARPDRVLRLRGSLPPGAFPEDDSEGPGAEEPFELLIFRGFSSLTTHPTAFDPDRPALPEGCRIVSAELLQAPLSPEAETLLATAQPAEHFVAAEAWH